MSFHSHYWVRPKEGRDFLPLKDLVERIQVAFPQGQIDPEKGRKDTEKRLATLTRLGAPQPLLESYRYPGVYCYLIEDFNPELWIECMVWPLQAIGVTFGTEEHESRAIPLLMRLAQSLDYDVELDSDAA